MTIQYAVLFRIECLHEYFGGACRSLVVSPTEDCRAMMERYRMLFRSFIGGGAVYAPLQSPPGLLRQFNESLPLTFRLTSTEPALASYTELGRDDAPSQALFNFNNILDQQADILGGRRQLLRSADSSLQDTAVAVRAKMFSFTVPASASGDTLQVIEPLTRQILWQTHIVNPAAPVLFDLRKLPEGSYILQMHEKELLSFYLSNIPPAQQWGAIAIYPGGSRQMQNLPTNCLVLDSAGIATPKTFTLALESRKTIWRYYIIDCAGKQDFGNHELLGTLRKPAAPTGTRDSDIPFVRLPQTVPIDGRTAWIFESKSPLPLLQSPSTEFSLALRSSGNGKRSERPIRLPYPRPGSFGFMDGPEPRSLCSEVFVYV